MKPTRFNTAVLLLLVVSSVSSDGDTGESISCSSPGTVLEGHSAAISCSYHQNVQNEQKDFYIYRSQANKDPVIVAICAWEKSEVSCDLKDGYGVSVNASRVTLNITSALPFHAGKYSCSTLPPTPGVEIKSCNLTVQEKVTPEKKVRAFCRHDGQEASVMCIVPDGLDTCTVILERHDLLTNTKPAVEVMRCDTKGKTCTSSLAGYLPTTTSQTSHSFSTVGVTIPAFAADKSGLYVCRTDSDTIASDMCTLKSFHVSTRQDTEAEAIRLLVVPLYAILGCLVLFLIITLVFVIKRCRRKKQGAPVNGELRQQLTPLNHKNLNGASAV